ncbi:hypothetical protein TPAR_06708 [Tolypocladium paradoxum]|uniref:Uncharacterized protein n=1 Tax=Tolypocladium paradoxum TaxID=94208 RepID=A0A2S4KSG5_9HYPO|nr:hypothetical protein TPAR_06708 [Tolypocladium paradoxum]
MSSYVTALGVETQSKPALQSAMALAVFSPIRTSNNKSRRAEYRRWRAAASGPHLDPDDPHIGNDNGPTLVLPYASPPIKMHIARQGSWLGRLWASCPQLSRSCTTAMRRRLRHANEKRTFGGGFDRGLAHGILNSADEASSA